MTDKKLTDAEIRKALKCHFNEELDEEPFQCVDCPLYNDTSPSCTEALKSYALDLINRQKAEIKRYKRYYYRHEYDKQEKEIKTEAYQEFAKFLIDKSSKGLLRTSDLPDYVKEMAGN